MGESALLPNKLRVSLKEVNHSQQLLTLFIGIQKELAITKRAASQGALPLRHSKNCGFRCFFFGGSQKADPIVSVEGNSKPYFFFELMTFEDTFDTIKDSRKDTSFHHVHAEFHQDNHLNYIDPLLHVELVRYAKIYNALSCYLGARQVYLIH